jgi:hypothetical protein
MALIRADLEAMQSELKAVRKELKGLLDAWNTATGANLPKENNREPATISLWLDR